MPHSKINPAFTLAELLIVIAVVMILAAAAITGSAGLIKNLRFGNAFNKMVFMVQQARSQAITGKNQNVKTYELNLSSNKQFILLARQDGSSQILEKLLLEQTSGMELTAKVPPSTPCNKAAIIFQRETGVISLRCDNNEKTLIEFGIQDTTQNRQKSFSIHSATGIPQITN